MSGSEREQYELSGYGYCPDCHGCVRRDCQGVEDGCVAEFTCWKPFYGVCRMSDWT